MVYKWESLRPLSLYPSFKQEKPFNFWGLSKESASEVDKKEFLRFSLRPPELHTEPLAVSAVAGVFCDICTANSLTARSSGIVFLFLPRALIRGSLEALDYCHSQGVTHGSLGAGCVLLSTFDNREAESLQVGDTTLGLLMDRSVSALRNF
jgi:hypothetical protein